MSFLRIIAVGLILCSAFGVLIYFTDRTQFIHSYGYSTPSQLHRSGLSFTVRFQAGNAIRNVLPERVVGPPWHVVIAVSSPSGFRSVRLKGLTTKRVDGACEDCRIVVAGGLPTAGVTVVDATINEGKWGEHTDVTALFEVVEQGEACELRVDFPLDACHQRLLRVP